MRSVDAFEDRHDIDLMGYHIFESAVKGNGLLKMPARPRGDTAICPFRQYGNAFTADDDVGLPIPTIPT